MYELTIQTKDNIIRKLIKDYNSPEVRELLQRSDIVSIEWHQIKDVKVKKRVVKK